MALAEERHQGEPDHLRFAYDDALYVRLKPVCSRLNQGDIVKGKPVNRGHRRMVPAALRPREP